MSPAMPEKQSKYRIRDMSLTSPHTERTEKRFNTEARSHGDDTEKTAACDRPAKRGANDERVGENASRGSRGLAFSPTLSSLAHGRPCRPLVARCSAFLRTSS